jgi:hypothetical protein
VSCLSGRVTALVTKTWRAAIVIGLVLALGVASAVGLLADAPKALPDVALGSRALWHLEIAAAFFVAFYLLLMMLVLGAHGRMFTKLVGPGGISAEAGDIAQVEESQAELLAAVADLQAAVQDITALLDEIVE